MAKKKSIRDMTELTETITTVYSSINTWAKETERILGEGAYIRAMTKAFDKMTEPMYEDMKRFVSRGAHYQTGETLGSLSSGDMTVSNSGMYLHFELGFNINKGGFPALILEYGDSGSPKRKPNTAYFFVYWAVKNHNLDSWEKQNEKVFVPIFKELSDAKKIGVK